MSTKSPITTHVLDTHSGVAAQHVFVTLLRYKDSTWKVLGSEETNSDGRCTTLLETLEKGRYKLTFDIESYFQKKGIVPFFPLAEVVFDVTELDRHYHVPLVVTPFAYQTYRGT